MQRSHTLFVALLLLAAVCTADSLGPLLYETIGPFPAECDIDYELSVTNSTETMNLYVTTADYVSYAPAFYYADCSCIETTYCQKTCKVDNSTEELYIVISSNSLTESVEYTLSYAACLEYLYAIVVVCLIIVCCCCCLCIGGCVVAGIFCCGCGAALGCATRSTSPTPSADLEFA